MRLGYELTIEQSQKLMMTPELIQAIQILQFTSEELEDFIEKEINENPMLEIDETKPKDIHVEISRTEEIENDSKRLEEDSEIDLREKVLEAGYDDISYNQWQYNPDSEQNMYEQFAPKEDDLKSHLIEQLSFSNIKSDKQKIARFIIANIDDNGYLKISDNEVIKHFDITKDEYEDLLDDIQQFDPIGVGSRTLEECLLVQLRSKGLLEDSIQYVILHNLKDIGDNRLNKIAKETGLSIEEIQLISKMIRTLEPKPGAKFVSDQTIKYIIPDVVVEKVGDEYKIMSNDGIIPHLIVSPYYSSLKNERKNDAELDKYLSEKYDKAIWLIKSIEQRRQTIYNVVSSVVTHQIEFLEKGIKHMKTLTLKDVASDINVHESTVSRAINGKYVQIPSGVFEIKYFFSSGVSDANGEGMSSNSIKTFIKEIIDNEDSMSPVSDQFISDELLKKGIEISRRTVAKYREEMCIPSSAKRRRY